jgi:uncharacterized small protein (TIGR04563 family)
MLRQQNSFGRKDSNLQHQVPKTSVLPLNYTRSRSVYNSLMHDKRKQSLYFPVGMLEEVVAEATRMDRSLSWVVQKAWEIAKEKLRELPAAPGAGEGT